MSEEIIVLNLETKTGPIQYNLIRLKHGDKFCWKERSLFEDIIITTDLNNEWKGIKKIDRIITKNDKIKEMFLKEHEKLSEEGFEFDDNEFKLLFPYDPEQIRIATKNFSIFQVYQMIKNKDIELHPEFQRHFVWEKLEMRSRLIESILLKIPLPVFYVAQDKEGLFTVIDGLQRLSVIESFMDNNLKLSSLEYLKDCEGCYYNKEGTDTITAKYKKRLEQEQLTFNIVEPQTPFDVKFDIFRRLNIGGKPLNSQEIRNSMSKPHIRQFIKKLAESKEFKIATDNGVSNIRMKDQELILKFISFYVLKKKKMNELNFDYKSDMPSFLDNFLGIFNDFKENDKIFEEISKAFKNSMQNAYHLFGDYAFRKIKKEGKKPLINTQLFLTFSLSLSQYDYEEIKKQIASKALIEPLNKMIMDTSIRKDEPTNYFDAISYGINSSEKIEMALKRAEKLVQSNLKGKNND